MEQYLTRSLITPAIKLQPFLLATKRPSSSVTICAWLPDTDLHFIDKWSTNWNGMINNDNYPIDLKSFDDAQTPSLSLSQLPLALVLHCMQNY